VTQSEPRYGERSSDTCYRHPDRQSFVLCQRCGRTICSECQIQAPVGVHCPDCVREARGERAQVQRVHGGNGFVRWVKRVFAPGSTRPVVTWIIAALCILLWLLELIPGLGSTLIAWLGYYPPMTAVAPWQLLTSGFVHSPGSILHIGFNMWALLVTGPVLEHLLGRGRFLALYLLSLLGGSVAVLLIAPGTFVIGASGAIFGLFGAFMLVLRGLGQNPTQILVVIGINLVIGFIPGFNVAWQAHVGGLIVGLAVGWIFMRTRGPRNRGRQIALVALVGAALIVLTIAGYALRIG
jgi:membrane associated rhomboid family serine protease